MNRKTFDRKVLRDVIRIALRLEQIVPAQRLERLKVAVGYGFLVRNRRLAMAIDRLGEKHAYEGRMLLRSMLEIQINYSWVRLGHSDSRARRFRRFEPIELLQIIGDIQSAIRSPRLAAAQRRLTQQQAATRHLFRRADSRGKRRWDKHWASVSSLRDRYIEIARMGGQPPTETFIYGLYRWSSSAVHGGPFSFSEVLESTPDGPRAKRQPEQDPHAQLRAAALTLFVTLSALAKDSRMIRALQPEIGTTRRAVMRMAPRLSPYKR